MHCEVTAVVGHPGRLTTSTAYDGGLLRRSLAVRRELVSAEIARPIFTLGLNWHLFDHIALSARPGVPHAVA